MPLTTQQRRIILGVGLLLGAIVLIILVWMVFFRPIFSTGDNENTNENVNVNDGTTTFPNVNDRNTNVVATNDNTNVDTNDNINVDNTNTDTRDELYDTIANGGLTRVERITDTYVQGATIALNGTSVQYYDRGEQSFIIQSFDGERSLLTDRKFPSVSEIVWAPGKDSAIITFPDESTIYYHFRDARQVTLPREMDDIIFSLDGTKIVYKFLGSSENQRWIGISSPDGTNQQITELIGYRNDDILTTWSPSGLIIALFIEQSSADTEIILPLGQYGENMPQFEVPGIRFQGKWLPSGDQLLFSVADGSNGYLPALWITDVHGERIGVNFESLGLATWAEKCAIGDTGLIICGVPREDLQQGAGLYPELAIGVPDSFWEIDLASGYSSMLAIPVDVEGSSTLSALQPFFSGNEQYLYFLDNNTQRLYRMKLKE